MRILFIGDIIGRPGRQCVGRLVPGLRAEHGLDLVIANGENAAGGYGLSPSTANELLGYGVDVLTLGNHAWGQKGIIPYLESGAPVARPLNYPAGTPGRGVVCATAADGTEVAVMNLMGRTFMAPIDNPFLAADAALAVLPEGMPVVVDFHAEATSEKQALGLYLDGRVGAVVGTHTHVPTADARVLPKGTLYCSDAGMVGPRDSVIGADPAASIRKYVTQLPGGKQAKPEEIPGPVQFNAVLLEIDAATGRGVSIRRIDVLDEPPAL